MGFRKKKRRNVAVVLTLSAVAALTLVILAQNRRLQEGSQLLLAPSKRHEGSVKGKGETPPKYLYPEWIQMSSQILNFIGDFPIQLKAKPIITHIQRCPIRWALGCVNPASRSSLAAGATEGPPYCPPLSGSDILQSRRSKSGIRVRS